MLEVRLMASDPYEREIGIFRNKEKAIEFACRYLNRQTKEEKMCESFGMKPSLLNLPIRRLESSPST